jgi:hypothetical protein
VFADRECSTRLPVALPEADVVRFHRIAVAHGSAGPNRREHGAGSGSLMINTLVGAERPFTVGREGPQDSFVHVLDEATLGLLLTNLDTLPEFRDYILAKERLLIGGTGIKAHGEEDLLAVYLTNMGIEDPSRHGFGDTEGVKVLEVPNGEWIRFEASAEKLARDAANVNSYLWDALIDRFAKHSIEGTQHFTSASGPQQTERTLRILNAVPRTQRRALIDACLERISTFGGRSHRVWSARSADGTSAFTFLVVAREDDEEYEDYRRRRLYMLTMCTALDRIRNPEIPAHVGIGQGLPGNDHSEDVVLVDEQSWSQKLEEAAVSFRDEFGIRRDIRETHKTAHEYPVSAPKDEDRS